MAIDQLNEILGLGTLALQVVTLALVCALLLRNRITSFQDVLEPIGRHAFAIAFLLASIGSILTLYYSEVLGVDPCVLCWWQRVFLYPQIILFGLGLWTKDVSIRMYAIALSLIGLGIALYHHALQMLPVGALPCPAEGVSCAKITFMEFGYITYPLMAATLFAFLIVLMFIHRAVQNAR